MCDNEHYRMMGKRLKPRLDMVTPEQYKSISLKPYTEFNTFKEWYLYFIGTYLVEQNDSGVFNSVFKCSVRVYLIDKIHKGS